MFVTKCYQFKPVDSDQWRDMCVSEEQL
jgi:hypothetical protein